MYIYIYIYIYIYECCYYEFHCPYNNPTHLLLCVKLEEEDMIQCLICHPTHTPHTHTHTHTQIHIYTHTYICTHTHTHTINVGMPLSFINQQTLVLKYF